MLALQGLCNKAPDLRSALGAAYSLEQAERQRRRRMTSELLLAREEIVLWLILLRIIWQITALFRYIIMQTRGKGLVTCANKPMLRRDMHSPTIGLDAPIHRNHQGVTQVRDYILILCILDQNWMQLWLSKTHENKPELIVA